MKSGFKKWLIKQRGNKKPLIKTFNFFLTKKLIKKSNISSEDGECKKKVSKPHMMQFGMHKTIGYSKDH